MTLAAPLAVLVLIACLGCARKLLVLWRALPRDDDGDHGGPPRWWGGEDPQDPTGGPGGISFDWTTFEREFWAYLSAREAQHARESISV